MRWLVQSWGVESGPTRADKTVSMFHEATYLDSMYHQVDRPHTCRHSRYSHFRTRPEAVEHSVSPGTERQEIVLKVRAANWDSTSEEPGKASPGVLRMTRSPQRTSCCPSILVFERFDSNCSAPSNARTVFLILLTVLVRAMQGPRQSRQRHEGLLYVCGFVDRSRNMHVRLFAVGSAHFDPGEVSHLLLQTSLERSALLSALTDSIRAYAI